MGINEDKLMEQLVVDAVRTEPDYIEACKRLKDPNIVRLLHVAMGLATEAGEFVDALKRHIFYGTPVDKINLIEELGDTSWYQRIGCSELDVAFMTMLSKNVDKLRKRFPEKFTEDKAVKRDWAAERRALESSLD